jgi:ATP-dependent DNA helicase PIF1
LAIDEGPPDMINKHCRYLHKLEVRIGAQVMLLKNMTSSLVNGSTGIITEFSGDGMFPVVQFGNGIKVTIGLETWESEGISPRLSRTQVPLILAWAVTIHKSQGQTIDYAIIDLKFVFVLGQIYVGLSRVPRIEGLQVLNFKPEKIRRNHEVDQFYSILSQI